MILMATHLLNVGESSAQQRTVIANEIWMARKSRYKTRPSAVDRLAINHEVWSDMLHERSRWGTQMNAFK
jgi:hypothetical protein